MYPEEISNIDWINGKIFSTVTFTFKNDYNFAHNKMKEIESAREKAKINYYGILKNINVYESTSVLDYIESSPEKNDNLFKLLDNAGLSKIEYPKFNTVKLTYYIEIYGKNSLINILMPDEATYTDELKNYTDFHFNADYTGVIIDARGTLDSFDGNKVKVKPCIFVTIKDDSGKSVITKNNVLPEVILDRGMVRYSYDIKQNQEARVGEKPLRIVAYGAGDRAGGIIVISQLDAQKILSSEKTRNSVKNGNMVIVINP
jgi:hypothetical protein